MTGAVAGEKVGGAEIPGSVEGVRARVAAVRERCIIAG
jgi:hypothetical protein